MLCFVLKSKVNVSKINIPGIIPLKNQLIPTIYKCEKITRNYAITLLNGKQGRRDHTNGLVYCTTSEVPKDNSKNGWDIVLRKPSRKNKQLQSAFHICFPSGNNSSVYVEFIDSPVHKDITQAVDYYLANHSRVRDVVGEKGDMVPIGRRVDIRTSTLSMYKATKSSAGSVDQYVLLNRASFAFNKLLLKSCCKLSLQAELKLLTKKDNILKVYSSKRVLATTLPTMAVSRDLTNSIHVDKSDDSRSYSVFYQSECNKGLCYFLIPSIGLAIEISSTVIISWDGRVTPHCSATVLPGIVSLFGSSNKFVTARLVVAKAFQCLKKTYSTK